MIEHELIFLGLLNERPKHGYEIKKEINDILFLFAGVNVKSIYYPLRILEKKHLILKETVAVGRRPKRFVYTLTLKGQQRFQALLTKSFLDFKRPQFSLDLSLYFLDYINPRVAKRRLRARVYLLRQLSRSLAQVVQAMAKDQRHALANIADHNLKMIEAEAKFLNNLTGIIA